MLSEEEFRSLAKDWKKSSLSGHNGNCIHIATVGDTVGIIEVGNLDDADSVPVVLTPLANFRAFITGAKMGEFDV